MKAKLANESDPAKPQAEMGLAHEARRDIPWFIIYNYLRTSVTTTPQSTMNYMALNLLFLW